MPGFGPFAPGTKIFLEGDGTGLPTSHDTNRLSDFPGWTNQFKDIEFNPDGEYEDPGDISWVIGIDRPRLTANRNFTMTNSRHVIFDGVVLDGLSSPAVGCAFPTRGATKPINRIAPNSVKTRVGEIDAIANLLERAR